MVTKKYDERRHLQNIGHFVQAWLYELKFLTTMEFAEFQWNYTNALKLILIMLLSMLTLFWYMKVMSRYR